MTKNLLTENISPTHMHARFIILFLNFPPKLKQGRYFGACNGKAHRIQLGNGILVLILQMCFQVAQNMTTNMCRCGEVECGGSERLYKH